MCDKILCHDRTLGRYWIMDVTDLDKLVIQMNAQLSRLGKMSINDIIDVINGYLPKDNEMQMVTPLGNQFGISKCVGCISYKYQPVFVPRIDGRVVVDFSFDPEEDEEQ